MAMLSRQGCCFLGSFQQCKNVFAIRTVSKTLHGPNPDVDYRRPIPKVHRGPYKDKVIRPLGHQKSDFHLRRGPQLMESGKFPDERKVYPKGKVAVNKPIMLTLEAGKKYSWCTCGFSHTQPMCDGSHRKLDGSGFEKKHQKFRPIRFEVEETKEYWLCQCKQSSNRPYCDGTHRRDGIADKKKVVVENPETVES